jgi:peptidyl-dipeptidase Dcp
MRNILRVLTLSFGLVGLSSCASTEQAVSAPASETVAADAGNPLLVPSAAPLGAVPFDRVRFEHLAPALDAAIATQRRTIDTIVRNTGPATFANTIEPLERTGSETRMATAAYGVYTSNLSNDTFRTLETDYTAKFARLQTETVLNPKLFARVKAVREDPSTAQLGPEAVRLAERTHDNFVRAGAALSAAERGRVATMTERIAALQTRFNQNLLRDTDAFRMVLEEPDLVGLPPSVRSGAAQAAATAGMPGKYVFTLQRPSYEGFMTYAERRDLRERLYKAFINRGDNGNENDNNVVIAELVKLRAERARILGFDNHAALVTSASMAQTPAAVLDLLQRVWEPALMQGKADARALQALIDQAAAGHPLEGWDWRYYGEQLRQQKFALDPAEVEPYFGLDNMLQASFFVSERLFGLRFAERKDIPVYHEDVQVFEVKDQGGRPVGLFYFDPFAREGKRSGAWMASYRPQNRLDGAVTAHVSNNLNVPKPAPGQPALISLTEANTLFHEVGHGLHGLLSDVTYPSLSGTAVPRDYVEFHAQLLEHYLLQPQVLKQFARHVGTGEPISDTLIERIVNAEKFNQSHATLEYVASALVDQRFHTLTPAQADTLDPRAFERQVMQELGALRQIPMRHRSPHFAHIFGGGYDAAYYAYMWSEVLDADGFAAFTESGDIFDPAIAARLKQHVYSRGNTVDWAEGYRAFRGRDPAVEPLLRNRGLLGDGGP